MSFGDGDGDGDGDGNGNGNGNGKPRSAPSLCQDSQVRRVRMSCCLVSQTPVRDSLDGDRCRDPHGLMASLLERYAPRIAGVLSCYDRVIVHGLLNEFRYPAAMAGFLRDRGIQLFDFTKFASPLRESIRGRAELLARENGIEIQFVRSGQTSKEQIVADIVENRGEQPGLVAILSAVELCKTYDPWFDKTTQFTSLKFGKSKCLNYYFYFIDEDLGLCFLRVPTWCPFDVQFYCNGHNILAAKLRKAKVEFRMLDNAFTHIDNWELAQTLADESDTKLLHEKLDIYARKYCPPVDELSLTYGWYLQQVEYSTDVVFRSQQELKAIYETLVRTAIHTVRPDNIATFLGKKLRSDATQELGNDFNTRIYGTRIKHRFGPTSIKMYDKAAIILRIETTTNDPGWFSHYRTVAHRDGTTSHELAPLKKSIYSLHDLRQLTVAANRRYLEFLSSIDDPTASVETVGKLSEKVSDDKGRSYRGFNFFEDSELRLFEAILRGEHTIRGMRNIDVRKHMPDKNPGQMSRLLKRLRMHGLIKKVGKTYKYYLTDLGRKVLTMGLKLKKIVFVPGLEHMVG